MRDETTRADDDPREIFAQFVAEYGLSDDSAYRQLLAAHPALASKFQELRAELRTTRAPVANNETPKVDIATRVRSLIDTLAKLAGSSDRFDDKGEIARGGMGKIVRLFDPLLRRSLVKKVVLPREDEATRQIALGRFLEEAQITAQLDHPGVVPVHDLGVDSDGALWFSMRLVKGEDLRTVFDKSRHGIDGWNLTRCVGVVLRICETMAYAHGKAVIHRDLKPGNVMVGRFGETYVMDWGLARVMGAPDSRDLRIRAEPPSTASEVHSDLRDHDSPDSPLITMDGQVIGTPVYMSPEQASGDVDNVGPLSDLYSVGAILYELLAGHMPYLPPSRNASKRSILQWVLNGPPEPLAKIAPEAPAPLIAICEKAMARDRHARYASMQQLAEDLRAWLEGRVVSAHESGALAHAVRWVDRNRGFAGAIAALFVAVSASGFLLAFFRAREIQNERQGAHEASLRVAAATADRLVREFDGSWPIEPATVPRLERWIEESQTLLDERDLFVREFEAQQRLSRTLPESVVAEPEVLRIERSKIQTLTDTLPQVDAVLARPNLQEARRERATKMKELLPRELAFRTRNLKRLEWANESLAPRAFDSSDAMRRYQELGRLMHDLRWIAAPESGLLALQRLRIAACSTIEQRSLEDHADEWRATIDEIADRGKCPQYAGLVMKPQPGLVPLGKDPKSGLFEFWHVASGDPPKRSAEGTYEIGADTGLVVVLVPGGHCVIGASSDPKALRYDPAARSDEFVFAADIEPYLLSKYEMTIGQWMRLADELPNEYHPGYIGTDLPLFTFSNPVEFVSSTDALRRLADWKLTLPTQAQWERAARGGTETPYWWGAEPDVPAGFANMVDCSMVPAVCPRDDGYRVHAPVDAFPGNPFGFHSILGNVSEWCSDWYFAEDDQSQEVQPGGELIPALLEYRAHRGGCFSDGAASLRASARGRAEPDSRLAKVGVRPLAIMIR